MKQVEKVLKEKRKSLAEKQKAMNQINDKCRW